VFDLAETELGVRDADLGGVGARLLEHGRRHVHADHAAGRADFTRGEEAVDARARAQVEHDFAGLQRRVRERIAAAEAEIGAFGQRRGLLLRVAELQQHGVHVAGRAAAARVLRALGDRAVLLADDRADVGDVGDLGRVAAAIRTAAGGFGFGGRDDR
jgi:hypothetical protein